MGGKSLVFDVADSDKIVLRGGNGGPLEITCGPQKGRKIRLEYETTPQGTRLVRSVGFP